jgi:hypothetical protein
VRVDYLHFLICIQLNAKQGPRQEHEYKYRMVCMDGLHLDNADSAVFAHYLRN